MSVNPENLENQDDATAVKVFNNETASKLDILTENGNDPVFTEHQGTTEFIRIITKWFDLTIIRRRFLDERHLMDHMSPFSSADDKRFAAFDQYSIFIEDSELMTRQKTAVRTGSTTDTFKAI